MWGRRTWVKGSILLVPVIVVASGCALDESASIAVQRPIDAPLGLDILFGDCGPDSVEQIGGDRVTDIAVMVEPDEEAEPATTTSPDDPTTEPELPSFSGSEFDRTLWSVHSDDPRHVDTVRVGSDVPGFTTEVPLTEPLPQRLRIVVGSDGGSPQRAVADLSVILDEVPADGTFVLDENGVTTFEDFQAGLRDGECDLASDEGGRSTLGSSLTSLLLRLLLLMGGLLAVIAGLLVWQRRGAESDGDPDVDDDPDVDGGSPP